MWSQTFLILLLLIFNEMVAKFITVLIFILFCVSMKLFIISYVHISLPKVVAQKESITMLIIWYNVFSFKPLSLVRFEPTLLYLGFNLINITLLFIPNFPHLIKDCMGNHQITIWLRILGVYVILMLIILLLTSFFHCQNLLYFLVHLLNIKDSKGEKGFEDVGTTIWIMHYRLGTTWSRLKYRLKWLT